MSQTVAEQIARHHDPDQLDHGGAVLMDLVSPAIAGAVGYVGRWLHAAARANHVEMPAPPVDLAIQLGNLVDDGLLLHASQVAEVQAFLEHPATQAVLRLSALESLARGANALKQTPVTAETLEANFLALASSWCEQTSQTWSSAADLVWAELLARQQDLLRPLADAAPPEASEIAVERFFFDPLASDHVPRYISVLVEVAKNREMITALSSTLSHARSMLANMDTSEFEVHGDESTARFRDLYVNRTLTDAASGKEQPAERVLDATDHPIRAVVIGDPGTGKSTLVKWFRWRIATSANRSTSVPVTVICREALGSRDATVLNAIGKTFEREYGQAIDVSQLEAMLATGSIVVIFDGLDEIQIRARRASVVQQIKTLENTFPMTPILCTTRRTGAEVPMFSDSPFRVLSLEQYSPRQVSEYALKWFASRSSTTQAKRFLGESRHLEDLRQNPLMLALLCALYSQQDYIPQSRREVYVRCAALMFREWDPRRGIDIPNIFKNRGDQALQAIATRLDRAGGHGQVLTRTAAESVVRDVLTRAGIEAVEAQASAKELIDHCATRAWILSVVTTSDGDRAVGFTHRTFFEFFAAEARVREINRQNAIGARPPSRIRCRSLP